MCFSSLVSEEEAGRGGEGRGEGWSWGGKGGTNRCASDTCCSCSPALQINSYRAGRCNERRWVNFVFVCLFVCSSWKLAHCSVFLHRSKKCSCGWSGADRYTVHTGIEHPEHLLFCLSHTRSPSHTHILSLPLTHTLNCYTWCCLAARLWLAIRELSTALVLKGVVVCRQLQFTAMPCLWWKCPPGFSSVLELRVKKQHLKAS